MRYHLYLLLSTLLYSTAHLPGVCYQLNFDQTEHNWIGKEEEEEEEEVHRGGLHRTVLSTTTITINSVSLTLRCPGRRRRRHRHLCRRRWLACAQPSLSLSFWKPTKEAARPLPMTSAVLCVC